MPDPRALTIALLALTLAGCGGNDGTSPPPGTAYTVTVESGNNQSGEVGTPLAAPLVVRVTDEDGVPAVGRSVAWGFTGTRQGLLANVATSTDAEGRSQNTLTLGTLPGDYTIRVATPGGTATATFTATATGEAIDQPILVAEVPVPANYGIHDTFVRDGIAFVSAWNTGIRIYDVGGGTQGGSPASPILISSIVTSDNGIPGGPQVHNAWWFHNPVSGQKRYLFVGQEGPGVVGSASSGDLHVVDISDLSFPVEVATLRIPDAGVHNFWMDEARQVLYASWYNGGVVAVDVSGTLSGNLANRIVAQVTPGGPGNTYVWGVMRSGNTLFASDMRSGLWALDPVTLATRGGGNNVADRFGSDLWIAGGHAYTGTWGTRGGNRGNAVKIWTLAGNGVPTLADSVILAGAGTISDVAVTPDGKLLVVTTENGAGGLYLYDRANPLKPALRGYVPVAQGLHTGEVAVVNGRTYVFAARNPGSPALMIFDITPVIP